MSTILIVEDDILLADCYKRWLEKAGHTTTHVTGAQTALDALDDTLPDAIMLDILLHGANGIQFLHILRSHADWSHIPIVVCSSAFQKKLPDLTAYGVRAVLDKATLNRQLLCKTIVQVQ